MRLTDRVAIVTGGASRTSANAFHFVTVPFLRAPANSSYRT